MWPKRMVVCINLKRERKKKKSVACVWNSFASRGRRENKQTNNRRRTWRIFIITDANTIHLTHASYDCAIWHSFIFIVACGIKSIYDSLSVANWKETVYPWHNRRRRRRMHSTGVHQDTSVRSSKNDMMLHNQLNGMKEEMKNAKKMECGIFFQAMLTTYHKITGQKFFIAKIKWKYVVVCCYSIHICRIMTHISNFKRHCNNF